MTFLLRWIVDLFNAIASWYYRRKYGAAARHLGRPPYEEDGRRGFIIVEIDGLAYDYLRQALKQGVMPTLDRLIRRRRLRLARWRCGLPSNTPASQAGIMFGNNWDIPGFRWYEKETHTSVMCRSPGAVHALQDRISVGRAGLLRGGSSYTNIFDGGARLALFTLAALGRDHLLADVRGLGFLVLFFLSPLRLLRSIVLSLWTWSVYVVKRAGALLRPSSETFTFWGPLTEIMSNIVFREVTTLSVMVDIYRGTPAIYASYTGYDEIAHNCGVESKEAIRALRGLDGQIRQIDRIRRTYSRREYDLYLLSDHGQTPSVPFRRAYGQTLQQFIAAHTGQEVRGEEERQGSEGLAEARLHALLEEVKDLQARPHNPLATQLLRVARRRLEDRLQAEAMVAEWDLGRRGEIVVCNSGPLSHVYFTVTHHPMDLSEVTLLYPGLLESLTAHEGIGFVAGREGQDVIVAGQAGTLWIRPEGEALTGENPLGTLPDQDWVKGQLARLARFPHSGDLIVQGAWDGEREIVTFEEQVSSHGGLGGPQVRPFFAFSSAVHLPGRGIESAEEIYTRLVAAYEGED